MTSLPPSPPPPLPSLPLILTHHPSLPATRPLPPLYPPSLPPKHGLSFSSFTPPPPFPFPPYTYPPYTPPPFYLPPLNTKPTDVKPPSQKPHIPIVHPKSNGRQVSKGVLRQNFRVGAKLFSLAFDGGRTAPYHILEKRGNFVGSLWLGLDSLKWLLKHGVCFAKIWS
jgi:hypothetical protein